MGACFSSTRPITSTVPTTNAITPGGNRDPAAGDGEQSRRPGRDPRRLRRPHGPVFREQSRLPSRIAHHIDFPDYDNGELLSIAESMLSRQGTASTARASAVMSDYIARRRAKPHFAQCAPIRNATDRARLRQANRLFEESAGPVDAETTVDHHGRDIAASRVSPRSNQSYGDIAMNEKTIIAPSFLSADFSRLGEESRPCAGRADWIHLDVNGLAISCPTSPSAPRSSSAAGRTDKVFDCHLMIAPPTPYLGAFAVPAATSSPLHAERRRISNRSLQPSATSAARRAYRSIPRRRRASSNMCWTDWTSSS